MAATPNAESDELRAEYDLSTLKGGVRGKYYGRVKSAGRVAHLTADVAEAFPTDEAVNTALRLLIQLARQQVSPSVAPTP